MTILSYSGTSVNAPCLRYFKIISCWSRTAKSAMGYNYLIISTGFLKSIKKRYFLPSKSYAFMV